MSSSCTSLAASLRELRKLADLDVRLPRPEGLVSLALPQVALGAVVDGIQDVLAEATTEAYVEVDRKFPVGQIGEDLGDEAVHATLRALGFTTEQDGDRFRITVPTW